MADFDSVYRSKTLHSLPAWNLADIDAVLVLSFGGPEGPEQVLPFLENVTRGRGIPRERLEEVAVHYHHFDGVSPLNQLNREIVANVEAELQNQNFPIPVYFGNRNWHPYANDVAEEISRAGHRKVMVFATSAWGGYSGCRQYGEDLVKLNQHLDSVGLPQLDFLKVRQFFDHPSFINEEVEVVQQAFESFGVSPKEGEKQGIRLVFTAHSIPLIADETSGIDADGNLYSRQVAEASRLVADRLGVQKYDVVWQSASGNGKIPWLDPDIVDHIIDLHSQGVRKVVVSAIGFISDHMEVVWDLDNELQVEAEKRGMKVVRAKTVGHTSTFASMVVQLFHETLNPKTAQHLGTVPSRGCSINGAACEPQCCQPAKRPHS
ncbi:Ferrochelatase [Corynebacterium pseudotuberculosis]|uniref:ferrochelatase n=1 Tax=Corynebacterium pseudotuberculosis TaxID=1719 RepID=UPI00065E322C|nr:ferrochelatase [Corynebacterium pseudotuberculosis]AKP08736.1 Ferrochelatase [Corynebacterium pseudotuberculosis]